MKPAGGDTGGDETSRSSTPFTAWVASFNPFGGQRPQSRPQQDFFESPGGGEVETGGSPVGLISRLARMMKAESGRNEIDYVAVKGPEFGHRAPNWMENKNVAIDGTPLTDVEKRQTWSHKYRKELDIAAAVQEVKAQKRFEDKNDIIKFFNHYKRRLGFAPPLEEGYARSTAEARYTMEALQEEGAADGDDDEKGQRGAIVVPAREPVTLATPWKALMTSVDTGRPLAKVAQEYRPQIDFYGLDPFFDSAPSLVWFSTKCGIAIGLVQGTIKAVQAINVDVQFLRASGVGVLSILNASVLASVVKWGGNTTLLALAFVAGDRLVRFTKRRTLPAHDAQHRGTSNYVVGFGFAGATTGIMPWWVLRDSHLAGRMAVSGFFVGGVLGGLVGVLLQRLVDLNVARIDATGRQLRRYEALMLREKEWVQHERDLDNKARTVWW